MKAAIRLISLGTPFEDVASLLKLKAESISAMMCLPAGRAYLEEQEARNREATAQLFAERAWSAVYGPVVKQVRKRKPRKHLEGKRNPNARKQASK